MYFCPKCGKKVKKLKENLCESCYNASKPQETKEIEIKQCPTCNKFSYQNRWTLITLENLKKKINKKYQKLKIEIISELCPKCSKHESYFESVLQIRNPNKKITKFIEDNIEKQKQEGVFITLKDKVKGGIDYYLTSRRYASKIGKLLKKNFEGELKISPKLFTRDKQKSKNVYRLNVLFRLEK